MRRKPRCHGCQVRRSELNEDRLCEVCVARIEAARLPNSEQARILNRANVSLTRFLDLMGEQAFTCAVCSCDDLNFHPYPRTGAVTAMLCHACSKGMEMFRDRADWMRRAADVRER